MNVTKLNQKTKEDRRWWSSPSCLPVLVVMLFGIIQFGIVFNNYVTLTDAVRAGAREAAVARAVRRSGRRRHDGRPLVGRGSRTRRISPCR